METVKLNNLEWMTENLTGHGGVERDGNWYYTWNEAMKAVKEIDDGWRLPTEKDFDKLLLYGSKWDDERKGRWFGKDKNLFLPALYIQPNIHESTNILYGHYWSSTLYKNNENFPLNFSFDNITEKPKYCAHFLVEYCVRLVRDVQ